MDSDLSRLETIYNYKNVTTDFLCVRPLILSLTLNCLIIFMCDNDTIVMYFKVVFIFLEVHMKFLQI